MLRPPSNTSNNSALEANSKPTKRSILVKKRSQNSRHLFDVVERHTQTPALSEHNGSHSDF